jgi:hypothetical protein
MGKTPNSGRGFTRPTFQPVRTNTRKKPQTFGEFVTAAHETWGARRASGFASLAINVHLVEFRGPQSFVFSKRNLNYLPF